MRSIQALCLFGGLFLSASVAKAQDSVLSVKPYELPKADSIALGNALKVSEQATKPWQPKSGKALLWGILPGGGQIYNRKYWKLPIVWGALASCIYAYSFNNRLYQEYHSAYRDIMSADPSTNTSWLAYAPKGAKAEDYAKYDYLKSTLRRGNDYYRRYRDLSIVLVLGVYGLSLLDAYVDAELFTFDISPDLSVRVSPTIAPVMPYASSYQVGMTCQFQF